MKTGKTTRPVYSGRFAKKIVLIFITAIFFSLRASSQKCENFKEGYFKYKEDFFSSVVIKRSKKWQIEYDTTSGLLIKYRIKWKDNCSYTLIQKWSNNTKVKKLNGSEIYVKITYVNGSEYKYEAVSQDGVNSSYTIFKIKKL